MTTDGISRKADILKVTSEQEVTATSKQGLIPEGISVQWEQQGPFPGLRSEFPRTRFSLGDSSHNWLGLTELDPLLDRVQKYLGHVRVGCSFVGEQFFSMWEALGFPPALNIAQLIEA